MESSNSDGPSRWVLGQLKRNQSILKELNFSFLRVAIYPLHCHRPGKFPDLLTGLFKQSNHIGFVIQRALSKADSMQFKLLVVFLYKIVVFCEKKTHKYRVL